MMDRELQRTDVPAGALSAVREVSFALQDRDLPRVRMIYKAAFSELSFPSDMLQQAFELIDGYFQVS